MISATKQTRRNNNSDRLIAIQHTQTLTVKRINVPLHSVHSKPVTLRLALYTRSKSTLCLGKNVV